MNNQYFDAGIIYQTHTGIYVHSKGTTYVLDNNGVVAWSGFGSIKPGFPKKSLAQCARDRGWYDLRINWSTMTWTGRTIAGEARANRILAGEV